MKRPLLLVLAIGLIVGAGLLAALTSWNHGAGGRAAAEARAAAAHGSAKLTGGAEASAPGVDGAAPSVPRQILTAEAWETLQSGDLKTLVANLRAAGFPPQIVRAIVGAMLHEQYAERRRKIMGEQPDVPYWKPATMATLFSSPQMSALRQLAREEQDTLKQLLGPDSAMAELSRFYQQRTFGDLPSDKIDAVQRIQQDYSELRAQIFGDAGNGSSMLPWDREKLTLLDKEQRDDIAAALTPEELRQYDLHNSSTAQRLRSQLTYFNPTEPEFLAIYDLQSQFDQSHNQWLMGGMPGPEQMRQRQADQQQLQAQIKSVLGDQRYTDYQQSTDNGFMAANRIVSTLQLPQQNAAATWNLQQTTQQQVNAIRSDRGMTGDQRAQSLQTLVSQTEQQMTTLLTQTGLDAYKQTPGGMWLRSLEMSSRRPPAPTAVGTTTSTQTTTTVTTSPPKS